MIVEGTNKTYYTDYVLKKTGRNNEAHSFILFVVGSLISTF